MNGTDTRSELEDYLRRVRVALADLPADELTEVMEDVEPNVLEAFEETGTIEELTKRLGTPEAYAEELRTAGGYPPAPTEPERTTGDRFAARYVVWVTGLSMVVGFFTGTVGGGRYASDRYVVLMLCAPFLALALWLLFSGRVRRVDIEGLREFQAARRTGRSAVAQLPPKVVEYLRSMQPAWWLVRVVLLGVAFIAALSVSSEAFLLIGLLIACLVWAGFRVRQDRRVLPVVLVANAFAIGMAVALLTAVISDAESSRSPYAYVDYQSRGLSFDGQDLDNIYAVDPQGRQISKFYLYDGTGRPLVSRGESCEPSGPDLTNEYPKPEVDYTRTGCTTSTTMPVLPLPPTVPSSTEPSSPSTSVTSPPSTSGTAPPSTPETSAPPTTG
ncbi:DUF1700 domain-containing protein [Actinokineospora sp. G85]|uniref:DUF1700 domain-containing protein n=1 Tax=Actinokineospora sp. G85 TaxID=3406626 RepID=UPI003C755DD0